MPRLLTSAAAPDKKDRMPSSMSRVNYPVEQINAPRQPCGRWRSSLSAVVGALRHSCCLPAILLCGLSLAMTAGCSTATSSYRIVDSAQALGNPPGSGPAIVWLDDKRILFVGLDKERPYGTLADQLMIWNTGTGAVETYKANGRGIYCYNPLSQEISYFTSSDQSVAIDVKFWFGRLGQEREVALDRIQWLASATCEKHNHTEDGNPRLTGKPLFKLLDEHGYLWPPHAVYPSKENIPVQLLNPAGETVAVLPFGHKEIGYVTFYLFKQAYFIGRSEPLDSNEQRIGWWVYPDGRTEAVTIPPRNKIHMGPSLDRFYPTEVGIFIPHRSLRENRGGYLIVQGGDFLKVIDADVSETSVSPNGCQIAFKYEPDGIGEGKPATLRIMDFCDAAQ